MMILYTFKVSGGLIDYGKIRQKSAKIGTYRITSDTFRKNAGCIPLAVVIMTTANGMQLTFSGKKPNVFYNSINFLS